MEQYRNGPNISQIMTEWYEENKRDLPWRQSKDPYIIWISEVILQQTRVAQGLDYFYRFTKRFPNVASLANASEDEVLHQWQGLGYYSRARNLQAAAKDIMLRFGGTFPHQYKDVLSLKGIGEYTAAAIVSFVWDEPYPVVDGNVYRVLSRLFALDTPIDSAQGKKEFAHLADLVMDHAHPGVHNQAVMEFGALQCVPQQPDCTQCPLSEKCMAFADNTVQAFPVKQNKAKTKNRFFHYLYIIYNRETWLHRREGKDIWTGLYEFPLVETNIPMDFAALQKEESFRNLFAECGDIHVAAVSEEIKHVLSHQKIYARFYKIDIKQSGAALNSCLQVPQSELDKYAMSRLMQRGIEELSP